MAWITPTVDNLRSHISDAEFKILQQSFVADDQADPLAAMISEVVDEMRGYIAAGGIRLGLVGTIPQRLVSTLGIIVRNRAGNRFNVSSLISDTRKTEYQDAVHRLEQIAERKYSIEEPVEVAPESSGGLRPMIKPKREVFRPQDQDGI